MAAAGSAIRSAPDDDIDIAGIELDRAGHDPQAIRDWMAGTWGSGDNAAKARHTITTLADHWQLQGWTTTDMAAELRPQEDP